MLYMKAYAFIDSELDFFFSIKIAISLKLFVTLTSDLSVRGQDHSSILEVL